MANAATPIDGHDPYAMDHAWVERYVAGSVGAAEDPTIVADAIVAASQDPSTPLHVLVGDSAAAYVAAATQTGSVEVFQALATSLVEAQVGPRPPVV